MKKYLKHFKTNKKGFTLIEMIVVIAIIGILAAVLVPAMAGYLETAKDSRKEANEKTVFTAAQAAVTSLETSSFIESGTYTKTGTTLSATGTGATEQMATDLFGKIEKLIGTSNYAKLNQIIVEVDKGAVKNVTVEEDTVTDIEKEPEGADQT